MDATQFTYWLKGYTELGGDCPTPAQWEVIKEHLDLVFNKVTTKTVTSPSPTPTYCTNAAVNYTNLDLS
jgi:hypothetical protein